MAESGVSKPRQFFTKFCRALGVPIGEPAIVRPEDTSKELNQEIPATENPFPNKVDYLSLTPPGKGWRTLLRGGETRVFDGICAVGIDISDIGDPREAEFGKFPYRIDLLRGERREKLGYLTSGVATTLRTACAKVNPDSEMGRAIKQQSIPCRVRVYRGDKNAPNETDRYSYAHTDIVRRVKDVVKAEKRK
jgi:hypothetical protein